jgi:hypothetical protein
MADLRKQLTEIPKRGNLRKPEELNKRVKLPNFCKSLLAEVETVDIWKVITDTMQQTVTNMNGGIA